MHKCAKPDCFNQVSALSTYCCTPCRMGAQGRYEVEPHEHSDGCRQRQAARQQAPDA